MFRPLSLIFAAGVALFGATAANAGTHWSIGVNLPVPGVVVTNGGGYFVREPAPVYYAPAPVVRYAPVPAYEAPAYVEPRVRYLDEEPVYEVPYRVDSYRSWDDDRGARWERPREAEHARWSHARHEREERRWERDDHRRGDVETIRWHRD
jgi:hypothetical protein